VCYGSPARFLAQCTLNPADFSLDVAARGAQNANSGVYQHRWVEMRTARILLLTSLILHGAATAGGRTICVDDDGPADFNNIQAAIDDANDGDTIFVADGTYTGDGNRDIDFKGKAITLRSENGPRKCIIDCQGTQIEPHRAFYFHSGEDTNSILDGFTITNGYVSESSSGLWYRHGGGILCESAGPAIRNCIVTRNKADGGVGAGICCVHCYRVTITNCVITENAARLGGGIGTFWGGVPVIASHDVIVTNCTFSGNSAEFGGAIKIGEASNVFMVNCILWADTALAGPEIEMQGTSWGSKLSISYSNVEGGEAAVRRDRLHW
jgi:predicted outer membrane repeat protein